MASSTSTSMIPSDPPPTLTPDSFTYDVFLSFSGADTRNNFTGHLYDKLVMVGIHTFMDDPELPKGSEISAELMTAIEESRLYIVVFSKNYASSRWCLDELVNILECKKNRGGVVFPVFYGVEPSEVRWQEGSFEEAFRKHEANYSNQLDKLDGWRAALTEAANLSGFNLQGNALGSESRLISLIVKEVLSQVEPKKLFVAKHPVGVDARVFDVYSLLRLDSGYHVRLFGIWGMGGSGKTVIAKALYNKLLQSFDSSCFLENIRSKVSEQPNGLVKLQETLLNELLMRKNVNVGSVSRGTEILRKGLRRKNILIVLDDLDKASQVDALAGHSDWFGPGSVIILTTRDQHLLSQVKVDEQYEAKKLNSEESLELFSRHSFEERIPPEPYAVIADKFVSYSCGLPLAHEVLGVFLFRRNIQLWESAFEKLQKSPDCRIQKILKISYDSLDDDEQRVIFLDIACFFIGRDIDYVTKILNACGFNTEIGIQILKDRCLLTFNGNNKLEMHDLHRHMGMEIARQSSPRSRRSRLSPTYLRKTREQKQLEVSV